MSWQIDFLEDAKKELADLDGSLKKQVLKGILKVSENPLPNTEGGYGKPLGNSNGTNLTGCMKIKYRGIGIRVVYYLERTDKIMNIVIVSIRDDNYVYEEAERRLKK